MGLLSYLTHYSACLQHHVPTQLDVDPKEERGEKKKVIPRHGPSLPVL